MSHLEPVLRHHPGRRTRWTRHLHQLLTRPQSDTWRDLLRAWHDTRLR